MLCNVIERAAVWILKGFSHRHDSGILKVTLNTKDTTFSASILSTRLGAGVLQLALAIGLVVAVVCSSMIILAYYGRLIERRQMIQAILRDNAWSGIQYAMDIRESLPYYQERTYDLFDEGTDSVSLVRVPWGLFDILGASTSRGQFSVSRYALVGVLPDTLTQAAIYLPGSQGELSLAGTTVIVGNVYVPEGKVRMGFLAGKDFSGDKLVNGKRFKSAGVMPAFDSLSLSHLLATVEPTNYNSKIRLLEDLAQREFSFDAPNINLFRTDGVLEIRDSLSGNLIIHSSQKVIVHPSAFLRDVIVLADEIDILDGFKGSAQFVASSSIDIGKDCRLYYPSAVSLVKARTDSLIVIGDSSLVEGIVAIPGFDQTLASRGRLHLKSGASVLGYIYCNATAVIDGTIRGHITTARFEARSSDNYLLDAVIRADRRPDYLPAPHSWSTSRKSTLVKWLR